MQSNALEELRRLVTYLCQVSGIALPNAAAMLTNGQEILGGSSSSSASSSSSEGEGKGVKECEENNEEEVKKS